MHLKLKIHLNGAGRALVIILVALVFGLCQPEARASATSELSTSERQSQSNNHHQDNHTERKCRPMLNFGLPHTTTAATQTSERSTSEDNRQQQQRRQQQQPQQKLSQSIPDSFSFAIGDIDLPLTPADGAGGSVGSSVQTAMKLLAAFDSQLYGDSDDDEEDERAHENTIRFMGNRLSISGLNFTMLNMHLYPNGEPKFALGVNIANTTLSGRFLYDGPTPSLIAGDHSQLAAHYRMTIDGVLVTATSNLTKLERGAATSGVGTDDSRSWYRLATNELKMNISNLGFISIDILDAEDASRPTSNYMLKMLQRVLQKTIKRTYNKFEEYIRRTLELEGRRFLDCELTRFSPLLVENSLEHHRHLSLKAAPIGGGVADLRAKSADPLMALATEPVVVNKSGTGSDLKSTYLDDVARILGTEIGNSHLSRIGLPDFEYQRSLFGSQANINFLNGSLVGLDNIKLIGETRVKLLEEHLIVNASVGWVNLRPQYNWTLYFGGGGLETPADRRLAAPATGLPDGPNLLLNNAAQQGKQQLNASSAVKARVPMARGFVAFNIKAIDFDAVISKSVRSQSQMVVDELTIRRLDGPKMDIGGLPGMNRLTRTVVNFFMGRLKQRLVGAIQPALKQELERALNRLALFN